MRNIAGIVRRAARIAFVSLLGVGLLSSGVARAEILEEVVVRVNDSIITRSELQRRRADTVDRLRENFEGPELEARVKATQERLLLDMINEELLVQQAELTYDMDKYYERVRRDFMKINEVPTELKLAEMLEKEETTLDEFRRLLIRSNVPPDVISFEVTRKISVSPQEVQDFYDAHQGEFAVAGDVTLREIVILDQERGHDAARALVDDIQARLTAGETFDSLARTQSESPSREKGGLVGPYTTGELAPALEAQAFALPVGSVGEAIATSYGFHLIQVSARTDATVRSLEDVRDDVNLGVRRQKFDEAFDVFMTGLWKRNRVVLNPRYATGGLEDGGPYSSREALLPASNPMGPPPPATAAAAPSR